MLLLMEFEKYQRARVENWSDEQLGFIINACKDSDIYFTYLKANH